MIDINNKRLSIFAKYYMNEFLEFGKAEQYSDWLHISESVNREKLSNNYFRYPVIITKLKKGYLLSASPEAMEKYCFWKDGSPVPHRFGELADYLKICYPDDNVRVMDRMLLTDTAVRHIMDQDDTDRHDMDMGNGVDASGLGMMINEQGVYAGYGEYKAGYCNISETDGGYGNIVVFVEEEFRRRGIASRMLGCLLENMDLGSISPMYWVDSNNTASVRLAMNSGFTAVAREIVIGGVITRY